ncbi:MAG: MATE family efflux transporter [Alphaproteobacteria bacterium]|nr:MATE family efflux transporter [Alphaproteobacteria bacterium]
MPRGKPDPGPYRRVWRLAWPLILSNITVPIVGAVDTAVVGHLDDPSYIGGVALGALLFNFVYWGFGFLKMGTTGFVSQATGSEDSVEIRAVLARALLLAAFFGIAIAALRDPAMDFAFWVVSGSASVEGHARDYFAIRGLAAPLALANITLLGWFLGVQDTRAGLVQLLVINIANAVLDVVFVYGLGMDVEGVALATAIAQALGLLVSVVIVRRKLHALGGRFDRARILDPARFKALMVVNRDIFIRTLCLLGGSAYFMDRSAQLGDVALAANAVLLQFQYISAYGLDGFAHSTEAVIGKAVGRKDIAELRSVARASTVWAGAVAVGISVCYLLSSGVLIDLFTGIDAVRTAAREYVFWVVILPVASVWAFQLDGMFIGATKSVEMRNAMIASLVFYIPAVIALMALWGNHGLWAAYVLFMAARALTLWLYYPRIVAAATP